jgi:hypothetical protein
MKVEKNDVRYFERAKPDGKIVYEWSADMWICPDCNHKVLVGFGSKPIKFDLTKDDIKKAITDSNKYPDSVIIGKL